MVQLRNQSVDVMIEKQEIGNRKRRSNLTILGTQPSDAGDYACVAMNEPGSVMQQATLTVHGELTVSDTYIYAVSDYVSLSLILSCSKYHLPTGWSGVHCE